MCNKADISMGSKICDSCRKKLANLPDLYTLTEAPTQCGSPTDEQYLDAIATVNRGCLKLVRHLCQQLRRTPSELNKKWIDSLKQ